MSDSDLLSDHDYSPEPLPSCHEYVTGRLPSGEEVVIVLRRTETGWNSRSTMRTMFHHDYLRQESIDNVCGWLRRQLHGTTVLTDRQEALEHLTTLSETNEANPLPRTGFLTGNPMWTPREHAEAVCQHLERGW